MVRSIIFAAVLATLAAHAFGQIDFTPKETFYLAETTRVPNVSFHKGKDLISYSPPGKWTLSGGGKKLSLTPPEIPQAGATMQVEPAADVLPATQDNVKAYSDLAVKRLPREALKVSVVEALVSSFRFNQRAAAEVTLTYVHFGQQFTTNILFLPYDKELILFQFTARTAEFAPLAKLFRTSLFSLDGL